MHVIGYHSKWPKQEIIHTRTHRATDVLPIKLKALLSVTYKSALKSRTWLWTNMFTTRDFIYSLYPWQQLQILFRLLTSWSKPQKTWTDSVQPCHITDQAHGRAGLCSLWVSALASTPKMNLDTAFKGGAGVVFLCACVSDLPFRSIKGYQLSHHLIWVSNEISWSARFVAQ